MKTHRLALSFTLALLIMLSGFARADDAPSVKEQAVAGPNNVQIKVRMEGPYTADFPLQVVCYFKYTPEGAKRMTGAPVELDKELGGVIASLRERGEFVGEALETLLLTTPKGTIRAPQLLLIGLGDEASLSLERMEQVGRIAVREAARLGVKRVAFAPLIRDQGNSTLPTGGVGRAVIRGVLLAYDTEKRLQKEGLAKAFTLEVWSQEAGPAYFDETAAAAQAAAKEAAAAIAVRPPESYRRR